MAGRRLLLDTWAYAQFRRGHRSVVDLLAAAERVFLSTVTFGELEAGFMLGTRLEENRSALRDFLAEPFVGVQPLDEDVARRYGGVFASLRRAGTPIPTNAVRIAAKALPPGVELVPLDTDFAQARD